MADGYGWSCGLTGNLDVFRFRGSRGGWYVSVANREVRRIGGEEEGVFTSGRTLTYCAIGNSPIRHRGRVSCMIGQVRGPKRSFVGG